MLRKKGPRRGRTCESGRGREQREGSHAGARALKRRRVSCADHTGRQQHRGREWQIWTAICWLPTTRRGGVDRRRRDRRRRHVRAGSGRRCSSTAVLHTDLILKPVDDSREKAGAAGDAWPFFEHRAPSRDAHHASPSARADGHKVARRTNTMPRAQHSMSWLEPRRRPATFGERRPQRATAWRDWRGRSLGEKAREDAASRVRPSSDHPKTVPPGVFAQPLASAGGVYACVCRTIIKVPPRKRAAARRFAWTASFRSGENYNFVHL